jgi:hypothetical protein
MHPETYLILEEPGAFMHFNDKQLIKDKYSN